MKKTYVLKFFLFIVGLVLLLAPGYYLFKYSNLLSRFINLFPYKKREILASSTNINVDSQTPILKDKNDLTTILIIGIDSQKNSHTLNTDSIMTLTYSHKKHKVYLISYPRDLYVKYPDTYYHFKINAVYAYGKIYLKRDGIKYLSRVIHDITGLNVHYYVMVDFDGFRKIIDTLGGVTIDIPRGFVDYAYPDGRGGYKTVKFTAGRHTLTGEQALEYARSRKAAGPEGSDFARAARQQLIIKALSEQFKQKLKKNPTLVFKLFEQIIGYIKASKVSPAELAAAVDIFLKKGMPPIYSVVLTPSLGKGRLISVSHVGHLYTLIPSAGLDNWSYVHQFVKTYIEYPALISSNPTIYIYFTQDYNKAVNLTERLRNQLMVVDVQGPYKYKAAVDTTTVKYAPKCSECSTELKKFLPNAKYIQQKPAYGDIAIIVK